MPETAARGPEAHRNANSQIGMSPACKSWVRP